MSMFDYFDSKPYVFLKVSPSPSGLKVEKSYNAEGVFKIRGGMTSTDIETPTADASLAVRHDEPFVSDLDANLVGHCIHVARAPYRGLDYRIVGQVEGYDYDTDELDFYKLTLKRESLWDQSVSPLE